MANSAKPQSKQTESLGKTKTGGLSRFLSPERWTLISELNFRWFPERQDLHTISFTPREAKIEYELKARYVRVCLAAHPIVPSSLLKSDDNCGWMCMQGQKREWSEG
jgi:hypothetical protein